MLAFLGFVVAVVGLLRKPKKKRVVNVRSSFTQTELLDIASGDSLGSVQVFIAPSYGSRYHNSCPGLVNCANPREVGPCKACFKEADETH